MLLDKCSSRRVLIEADLVPMQGQRFQPTGFADLGAAVYTLPAGNRMLLVESVQSMANRLEQTICMPDGDVIPELEGISYVKVKLELEEKENKRKKISAQLDVLQKDEIEKSIVVTSLMEAHRLASPFIIAGKEFQEKICQEAGYDKAKPLDWKRIHETIFKYDVNSLLHGVFLSTVKDGRIKVPRLISGFIEAENVREAISGGVKNSFDTSGNLRMLDYDKDVYSNVPYQRTEYTAERITAYFNLDVEGIRSLGLPEEAQELLFCLALYKVSRLLVGGMRLRTACDLRQTGDLRCPGIDALPDTDFLLDKLQDSIKKCAPLFAQPPVTKLTAKVKEKTDKKQEEATDEEDV